MPKEELREKAEEAVEKAKEKAKQVGGFLGRMLRKGAEKLAEHEVVREKLEALREYREEREKEKLEETLDRKYSPVLEEWQERLKELRTRLNNLDEARELVGSNIQTLRLQGKEEDDPELADYLRQQAQLREEADAVYAQIDPLEQRIEKLERKRRAALALLLANPDSLDKLLAEAEEYIAQLQS
ncbi:MAG TPA: hypothetical protein EYP85_10280 [Armatimonadetes bacterium]|nr:hypothetical protein [Armatimonadota bacterium]